MGLIPEASFTVRVPAWWDTNREFVLDDYPGLEQAMKLAGHNWDVIERKVAVVGNTQNPDGSPRLKAADNWVAHLRSDNLTLLNICKDSFERIQNRVPYDILELVLESDSRWLFESAGSMDEGRQNYITALLNDPFTITGDTSITLPYLGVSWCHDGTGSLRLRRTNIRYECQNTVSAGEAQGEKLGLYYNFRHTKNVHNRINEVKAALKGVRPGIDLYREAMEELAAIQVTPNQRDMFVSTIIGDRDGVISKSAAASDRVKNNIEGERAKINALFFGPTIPDAHVLTGYGLHMAGVEYFDHLRAFRSKDSYVKRTLLTDNPAKAALTTTIREVVAA